MTTRAPPCWFTTPLPLPARAAAAVVPGLGGVNSMFAPPTSAISTVRRDGRGGHPTIPPRRVHPRPPTRTAATAVDALAAGVPPFLITPPSARVGVAAAARRSAETSRFLLPRQRGHGRPPLGAGNGRGAAQNDTQRPQATAKTNHKITVGADAAPLPRALTV